MKALGIMSSPQSGDTTSILLDECFRILKAKMDVEVINLYDLDIKPCAFCWDCKHTGVCVIKDAMFYDKILQSDCIIIASPTYLGSIPTQLKVVMDRIWCIRDKLKDKIGGAIVVGGMHVERALTHIDMFFLRHNMILGSHGAIFRAVGNFEKPEDANAIKGVQNLCKRILVLSSFRARIK